MFFLSLFGLKFFSSMLLFGIKDSLIIFFARIDAIFFQGFVWCGCEFKDHDFFVIVAC